MGIVYNIWDHEIAHCSNLKEAGLRCGVRDSSIAINYEQDITWTKKQDSADVTFFTDRCLVENIIDRVDSNIKVGWLIEPRAYHPNDYKSVELLENKLNFIFTHDDYLLRKNPDKYKFLAADWVCIEQESHRVHTKTNLLSMIYSNKGELDRTLRGQVATKYKEKINLFGTGTSSGQLNLKSFSLNPYCFSIAMENSIATNYYTEKIIDCFITGNVPIYRGCNNIGEFFDERGIITFNEIEELDSIIDELTFSKYMDMLPHINKNFEIAKKYINPDNLLNKFIVELRSDPSYNTKDYFIC